MRWKMNLLTMMIKEAAQWSQCWGDSGAEKNKLWIQNDQIPHYIWSTVISSGEKDALSYWS